MSKVAPSISLYHDIEDATFDIEVLKMDFDIGFPIFKEATESSIVGPTAEPAKQPSSSYEFQNSKLT
jgi:hypothetical protein